LSDTTRSPGSQTRKLLLIGFGGLLLLLAFSGINALSVLGRIQKRNATIRLDYLNRDRILQQLRSDLYLSGTYVRDLLLEPDPARSDVHRKEFEEVHHRIEEMTSAYRAVLRGEERTPFQRFIAEVQAYLDSLKPALQWDFKERQKYGYEFMHDLLLPRRMVIVRLADQISRLNQEQMETGSKRVAELFSTFRLDLILLLIATLLMGIVLAGGSIWRILRLERLSASRLDEATQARTALRDLSARLVEVQETERRAISRELHDEVGQSLSALLLALGNVAAMIPSEQNPEARAELLDTRRMAEKTVAMVRDMSLLLRPSMLDDLGLIPALEWQAREISRTHPLAVTVRAESVSDDLSDEERTCIYRVVQEALRNVTRHARAKHVQITLTEAENVLQLTIEDDGVGFLPAREKGVGLLGMEERVKRLHGSFEVRSKPGGGTAIHVELPKPANAS
jgi:signal transduction histidine kinase